MLYEIARAIFTPPCMEVPFQVRPLRDVFACG